MPQPTPSPAAYTRWAEILHRARSFGARAHATAGCTEAGFGAGPGCLAGKVEPFNPPARLSDSVAWVHARSHFYKRAHIQLIDGFVLCFDPWGFDRGEPRSKAPRPGRVVGTGASETGHSEPGRPGLLG